VFRVHKSEFMDAKGRLGDSPSKHREALLAPIRKGEICVNCGIPQPVFVAIPSRQLEPQIQSKIMSLYPALIKIAALQRPIGWLCGRLLVLDSAGRLLVSPALRELAGLEKRSHG